MSKGKASIVTGTIETFTEHGIKVSSGEEIPADIVVTATGFNLSVLGDVAFAVDGEPVDFTKRVTWRGIMINGLPNMAYVFGYFRHSWTLRVDLVSDLVGRLLAHMQDKGATMVVPTLRSQDAGMQLRPWSDPENFNPGYVTRSQHICSNRVIASRGPTCWSTSRSARSCPRRTSTMGRSSTALDRPGFALVAERVHLRDQVGGEGAGVVAVRGFAGQPGAALVGRDDLEVPGQRRHQQAPGVPGLGPAVHQQQRGAVAAGDHVLAQVTGVYVPAGERAGEPFREVRRPRDRAGAFRGDTWPTGDQCRLALSSANVSATQSAMKVLTWARWSSPMCSVAPSSAVKTRSSRFGLATACS